MIVDYQAKIPGFSSGCLIIRGMIAPSPQAMNVPNSLSEIARLAGFLMSMAATIYYLWFRRSKIEISTLSGFELIKRSAIGTIAVFLAISWGSLATSDGIKVLIFLAPSLILLGIVLLFVYLYCEKRVRPSSSTPAAVSTFLLALFFTFSISLACGLASASEFAAFLVLNPDNNKTGVTFDPPDQYAVVISYTVPRPDETAAVEKAPSEPIRFTKSSGQGNFGCEEPHSFSVEVILPKGANLTSPPTATWANADNVGRQTDASITSTNVDGGIKLQAVGTLVGRQYENLLVARNCPGGGHGELVLSGFYLLPQADIKRSLSKPQPVVLRSRVQEAARGAIWVTLSEDLMQSIDVNFQSELDPEEHALLHVTKEHPASSDGAYLAVWDQPGNRLGLMVRNRWQQLRARFVNHHHH